jgi:hypothetical protein
MSEHELLLREFQPRTALVTEDHTPPRARYPVVDAHNHLRRALDRPAELLELMDALNLRAIIDLDGGWGEQLDQHLAALKRPYPDRFCVFAWVDWGQVDDPDFGTRWAGRLADAVRAGAQGLKVFKSLGLSYRDRSGALIRIDDPRLDPVWAAAGELGIPVLIHSADPVAFFWPLDAHNERWEELRAHPDWHFYGGDYPSFIELIEAQLRVVARHPETTFISAHVLSYSGPPALHGALVPDRVRRPRPLWHRRTPAPRDLPDLLSLPGDGRRVFRVWVEPGPLPDLWPLPARRGAAQGIL